MGLYAGYRRSVHAGVRNLILQAKQVNAGSDSGALYPDFLLEDMEAELDDLERGALQFYWGFIRQMFYPCPRTPRDFWRRIVVTWRTIRRPLPPVELYPKAEGMETLTIHPDE